MDLDDSQCSSSRPTLEAKGHEFVPPASNGLSSAAAVKLYAVIEGRGPPGHKTIRLRSKPTGFFRRLVFPSPFFRMTFTLSLCFVAAGCADEILFQDNFNGKLGRDWTWVREDPKSWRVAEHGLEVRVQPGNMWGPANDARNVLVRNAPDPAKIAVQVSVRVANQPTAQYEQVDMVWFYDDRYMVKLVQEMVDGKLSIVMGREEADQTQTIAIIPLQSFTVQLQFLVVGNRIRGQFRTPDSPAWREAGQCSLPAHGAPKASLQCYQGSAAVAHWARFTEFCIRRLDN